MKLLFTRHGQTDWNSERKLIGKTDVSLDKPSTLLTTIATPQSYTTTESPKGISANTRAKPATILIMMAFGNITATSQPINATIT